MRGRPRLYHGQQWLVVGLQEADDSGPGSKTLAAKIEITKKIKSKDGLKKEYRGAAGRAVSVPGIAVVGGTIIAVLAYVL